MADELVRAQLVPQMQQESDHAGTGDVGAEEACKEPQRWCCSQEQWLTLCWGCAGESSWSRNSLVGAEPGLSVFPAGHVRAYQTLPIMSSSPSSLQG